MTTTARRLCTPLRDTRERGSARRNERTARPGTPQDPSREVLEASVLHDTGSWRCSRARTPALGRWWPALLLLALTWVAWLNSPGACALEESAWREADARLTRLMIRAHRAPSAAARHLALTTASSSKLLEQRALGLQSADATEELLRAKRELEASLGELRMCRHGAPVRAEREGAP